MRDLLTKISDSNATLGNLTAWFEVCFAVNLAYPILLNFGRFCGATLGQWADQEKLRVIPALAENNLFNESDFTRSIDNIEHKYLFVIKGVNVIIVLWAVSAAIVLFFLLLLAGLAPQTTLSAPESVLWFLFLSGAVPLGLISVLAVHLSGRGKMRSLSREHDGVLKFNKQAAPETVEKARNDLRQKLKEKREGISRTITPPTTLPLA